MRMVPFVVEGQGFFPLDMLRYDSCWPVDSDAVAEIHESVERGVGNPVHHRVRMLSANPTGPTVDRWESFGWTVVSVAGRKPR